MLQVLRDLYHGGMEEFLDWKEEVLGRFDDFPEPLKAFILSIAILIYWPPLLFVVSCLDLFMGWKNRNRQLSFFYSGVGLLLWGSIIFPDVRLVTFGWLPILSANQLDMFVAAIVLYGAFTAFLCRDVWAPCQDLL